MKSTFKRVVCALLACVLLLSGCGKTEPEKEPDNATLFPYDPPAAHATGTAYDDKAAGFQLDPPQKGEEIAVLHTNFGDIAIRLFPEGAPRAVENFKALIRAGYYNGLSFHRIIDGFMVQTGDPNGDGSGGKSSFGAPFADEFDRKLLNLRGALSMANPGIENQNDSQFFINQSDKNDYSEAKCKENAASYEKNYSDAAAQYKEYYEYYEGEMVAYYADWWEFFHANYNLAPCPDTVPQEVWDVYDRVGGNIHLDGAWRDYGGHTVFGQVFDGMDVVDAIAAIDTDDKDAPKYQVLVQTAELVTYDPATYKGSGLLSPELIPVKKDEVSAPVYPLGEPQASMEHTVGDAYPDRDYGFQLDPPQKGEEIAVLHTTKGDIRVRLFPEAAPQAVANFKALIKSGYYNGLTFHYVEQDFLIQSGDKKGDGTGGQSMSGDYLPDEFDKKLLNLRGALSMGNSGVQNTGTSQFFINQTPAGTATTEKDYWQENETQFNAMQENTIKQYTDYWEENKERLTPFYGSLEVYLAANATLAPRVNWVPKAVWELYEQHGGNIHLDGNFREYGGNTVFGQVFDGMDAVDAIAAVEVDDNGKPLSAITITSAELVKYEG